MLEDAVSENFVHNKSDISDSTPTKTMDAEDTMEERCFNSEDSTDRFGQFGHGCHNWLKGS